MVAENIISAILWVIAIIALAYWIDWERGRDMPVLSEKELIALTKGHGTKETKRRAEEKLREFQAEVTDPVHLTALGPHIKKAEIFADSACSEEDSDNWSKTFHAKANELTRSAGLRI